MDINSVKEFLIRAKKATYAGKGPEAVPSRPASHDLKYEEGDLLYIDTYLGGVQFGGEEAVWENGRPFWTMNYCGRATEPEFDGDFLKEALSKVPMDKPFRGPDKYFRDDYTYLCMIEGDFDWFAGHEQILFRDSLVYECMFHGGSIQ